MSRIRTIKPDAFTSDTLSTVSVHARWTFAGLWTYFDDEGRGRADVRLIKADLYPLDDSTSLTDVQSDVDALLAIGSLCAYEVDGRRYLHATKWEHQRINRPTPSRLPPCPTCESLTSDSPVSLHGASGDGSPPEQGTGNREQGGESAGSRPPGPDPDPPKPRTPPHPDVGRFDEFWSAYPRKTDKARAQKAWPKALKKKSADELVAAAQALAGLKSDPKFIPHASTWLNNERWDDQQIAQVLTLPAPAAPQSAGWFQPFSPGPAPAEVEADPAAYAAWLDERRAEHRAAQQAAQQAT